MEGGEAREREREKSDDALAGPAGSTWVGPAGCHPLLRFVFAQLVSRPNNLSPICRHQIQFPCLFSQKSAREEKIASMPATPECVSMFERQHPSEE